MLWMPSARIARCNPLPRIVGILLLAGIAAAPTLPAFGQAFYFAPTWPASASYYFTPIAHSAGVPNTSTVIERYYIMGEAPELPPTEEGMMPSLYFAIPEASPATIIIREYYVTGSETLRPTKESGRTDLEKPEKLKAPEWSKEFEITPAPPMEEARPSADAASTPSETANETQPESSAPGNESPPKDDKRDTPVPPPADAELPKAPAAI